MEIVGIGLKPHMGLHIKHFSYSAQQFQPFQQFHITRSNFSHGDLDFKLQFLHKGGSDTN